MIGATAFPVERLERPDDAIVVPVRNAYGFQDAEAGHFLAVGQ